jgi:group I intron endonuclease
MVQPSLLRFFNAPKFPSSIIYEDHVAPATPAPSISSNVSPICPIESLYDGAAVGTGHVRDLADEAVRSARRGLRGLFSSFADLVADIRAKGGRDAFVANLANNPKLYGTTRDTSRPGNTSDKDGIIYTIVNLDNKKIYVGQTNNFDMRMGSHFKKSGQKSYIKCAIKKHGREKFVSVILLAGIEKQEELDLTEIGLIKYLDCMASENRGYNLHAGGRGGPLSTEHRKKISEGNRGKKRSEETRAAISASRIRQPRTKEVKAAISAGIKKAFQSDEARARFSARSARMKKIVVVTLLETRMEIVCPSFNDAAKQMGVSRQIISDLVNNKTKAEKSKSNGGQYVGQLFAARYR